MRCTYTDELLARAESRGCGLVTFEAIYPDGTRTTIQLLAGEELLLHMEQSFQIGLTLAKKLEIPVLLESSTSIEEIIKGIS